MPERRLPVGKEVEGLFAVSPPSASLVLATFEKDLGLILSEIKHYLMKQKRATLGDLALYFDTEPEAMRGMLEQWIRKGRVSKSEVKADCNKTCSKCCDASAMVIYEWTH